MIKKIILTVMVLVICFVAMQILEQKVAPSHAAELAIRQFEEDGSREQLRIEQNAQNLLNPVLCIIVIGLLILIWWEELKKIYKKIENTIALKLCK